MGLLLLRARGIFYTPLLRSLTDAQKTLLKDRLQEIPPLSGFHPSLGWAPKPHTRSTDVRINSQGLRSEIEYAHEPDLGTIRISAFGDSFTFGSEVDNQDTWEHQMEEQDPRFQVLNFGMGAYGLDQAYLRYLQDGVPFNSAIVIIGFMSENIFRNVNVFRPFYSPTYANNLYTKPRFTLVNDRLSLVRNPLSTVDDYKRLVTDDGAVLREIGGEDYYYQTGYLAGPLDGFPSVRLAKIATQIVKEALNPIVTSDGSYAVTGDAFRLTARIMDEFYCAALRHGSLPAIVLYPDLDDFRRHRNHESRRYAPLIEHLQTKGFRYVDILDALVAYDPALPEPLLTVGQWGHYSRLGNRIVASRISDYVRDENLVDRETIRALAAATFQKLVCTTQVVP